MKRSAHLSRMAPAQHGIALMECLAAMLIFSFGMLGLLGLEARVMGLSTDSEDRNRAAMFASEVSSHMWLNGSVTLPGPDYTALQANVHDLSQGGVPSGVLLVTGITANSADIKITWQETADATLSTLTTRVVLP
jgi:type IV pilus assembly protein PilV